jgi:cytochrome d ubiquinol oxidase subunit II
MSWPPVELLVAGAILVALILYALTGGADYGGGVWDLLANGPRAQAQRDLITHAIGPIWEANHVWLIVVVVILFTAFPPAFAAISISLHIPLALALIGIVWRGSAFVFRAYDLKPSPMERYWDRLFASASVATPLLLGVVAGAIASGGVQPQNGFIHSWFRLFPIAVGLFAVALFAFLAAVYLTLETDDPSLQDDFRRYALMAAVVVGILALTVFVLARQSAPLIAEMVRAWPIQIATAIAALTAIWALWKRKYLLARMAAAAQVMLIIAGWLVGQFPYLVVPDITIYSAAVAPRTLRLLLIALIAGGFLLFPSFWYLYRIFKRVA